MSQKKVVVFGPGPVFKGGMANYTVSLAKALDKIEHIETHIVSWTQQYPAIIPRDFIDRKSQTNLLSGTRIQTHYITNYNNPLSWRKTVDLICQIDPDIVVFQWSVAVQGLPLGYITRKLKQHCKAELLFDLHFVIQKEESLIDRRLSRYGLARADGYIVHSQKTADELELLFPNKQFFNSLGGSRSSSEDIATVIKLYHPVYDMFNKNPDFDAQAFKTAHGLKKHVFLFFGFIRKYKGLHYCLEAFAKAAKTRDDISLLVVGESFWNTLDEQKLSVRLKKQLFGLAKKVLLKNSSDEQDYNPLALIKELGLETKVALVNDFVANEQVYMYFQASDAILLFYEYATPSGVESMAVNFELPVLATAVGHFPETIEPGCNGYLAKPEDTDDMAKQMLYFLDHPIDAENIKKMGQLFSWHNYATTILNMNTQDANRNTLICV